MESVGTRSRVRVASLAMGGAVLLIALVAYIDFITGTELDVEPLYILPVSLAAWHCGVTCAAVTSALSATVWVLSNELAGLTYSRPELWLSNMATQLLMFSLVGLLIAYLRRRVEHEEWSSRHDSLTGLPNARAFYEHAEAELSRARRYGGPLTAAYIDLDNFKAVNDKYGHKAGDSVLCTVAATLHRTARATDLAARLGGDEFVVLMPETSAEGARALLERLRGELETVLGARAWPVSASIGAVSFIDLPDTVDQLVVAADDRMYEAKREGKNSVCVTELRDGMELRVATSG